MRGGTVKKCRTTYKGHDVESTVRHIRSGMVQQMQMTYPTCDEEGTTTREKNRYKGSKVANKKNPKVFIE
ncbi:hypothetical protein BGZ51_000005 [Haplosporangium sp. Z 767]|nr:hypothetical protein BGZ51_000005 [Haplosporangium sp. Z 767]